MDMNESKYIRIERSYVFDRKCKVCNQVIKKGETMIVTPLGEKLTSGTHLQCVANSPTSLQVAGVAEQQWRVHIGASSNSRMAGMQLSVWWEKRHLRKHFYHSWDCTIHHHLYYSHFWNSKSKRIFKRIWMENNSECKRQYVTPQLASQMPKLCPRPASDSVLTIGNAFLQEILQVLIGNARESVPLLRVSYW